MNTDLIIGLAEQIILTILQPNNKDILNDNLQNNNEINDKDNNFVCYYPENNIVRVGIHALLRLVACTSEKEDRYIPCYPGKDAKHCRNKSYCGYIISQAIHQWGAKKLGINTDIEINRDFSGCNFYHNTEEITIIRNLIHKFLDENYEGLGLVENVLMKLSSFYSSIREPNKKSIYVFSCKNDRFMNKEIYLSDDTIFQK
jgi:hypothetical protein